MTGIVAGMPQKLHAYEVMNTFSRRARLTLITVYVIVAVLICVEYRRISPLDVYYRSETTLPSVEYKNYCVRPNVLATRFTEYNRIALILHISADYLDEKIVEQVTNWNAPVSLSVYLDNPNRQYSCLLRMLRRLSIAHPIVGEHLRVHFIYKKENDNCGVVEHPFWDVSLSCDNFQRKKSIQETAAYPANVVRNSARMFSDTKYILIADYEHMFSDGFERRVREVADRQLEDDPKQLLVYRIFEIDEHTERGPRTKSELSGMLNNKSAIVFHSAYYSAAHSIPGLEKWLEEKTDEEKNGIFLENLNYTRYNWEPQFVSLSTIPMHDESFPYQIRDNTCLRWELCRAGYRFSVLSDHFMYHKGIKRRGTKTAVINKKMQSINSDRFLKALRLFNIRMNKIYPDTKNQCPSFNA